MNQNRFRLAVVSLLLVALGVAARDDDPEPPKKDPFDRLTFAQIKGLLAGKAAVRIDASDDRTNQVPTGTVLVYRTSAGRYGKCKVVKYAYDLELKWLTYDANGKVFSKGDRLVVRGTFSGDLDGGKEGRLGQKADFFWEQATRVKRSIVPRNGAVLMVYRKR